MRRLLASARVAVRSAQIVRQHPTPFTYRAQCYSSSATPTGAPSTEDKRKVIERIRELYGIGFTLDDARGRDALQNYQTQQAGSLKLLSKELYSIQTHFVLEYIQNADDNKYTEGTAPQLLIHYDGEKIDFRNNERGFSDKDVRAICAVGQSTKDVKGGYIGEKGIGFKAGFTVANRVQIHSNGFHFEFEESSELGALGFVVPKWVDTGASPPDMMGCATLIRLFLKSAVKREELLRQLQDTAQPELLLFLRQLKTLALDVGDEKILTTRLDNPSNEITLNTQRVKGQVKSHDQVTYYTYKHTVETPRHISRGRGSEATDLIVAFPNTEVTTQKVFAFLPVKEYGLKFLLNADFYLASSREFIAEDNEWNTWLRSHVGSAFTAAFLSYLKHSAAAMEAYPYTHWEFVPLPEEADDFFVPILDQIWKTLSTTDSMPSTSEGGGLSAPCNLLFPPDEELAELITNADLQVATGKQFLPQHSLSDRMKRVYHQLGIKEFSAKDLHDILRQEGFLATKAQDPKWFIKLYKYLATYLRNSTERAHLAEIAKLPVVLLQSGKVISANISPVYFFPHSQSYGFEHELQLVYRDVGEDMTCVDVLENLGVQYTDRDMIIEKHIMPQLSKAKYGLVMPYVAYLADHQAACKPKVWEKIKTLVKLRDNKKTLRAPASLVLPDSLNTIKTEELLGPRMQYLDDTFIKDAIAKLVSTLSSVGANTTVQEDFIKETDWSCGSPGTVLHDVDKGIRTTDAKTPIQLETEKWTEFLGKLGVSRLFPIERGDCPSFPMIVNNVLSAKGKEGLVTLLTLASKVWDTMADVTKPTPDGRPSAFITRLRMAPFVVTSRGNAVATINTKVWTKDPTIVELFGPDAVEYCVAPITPECATALGINATLTPAAVLAEIPSLPKDPALLQKVYLYLYREFRGHSTAITAAFRNNELAFAAGGMRKLGDLVWRDPSGLVSSKYALAPHYAMMHELHAFFVGDLQVAPMPSPADYIAELATLAASAEKPDAAKIRLLYEQLADLLSQGDWTEEVHKLWKQQLAAQPTLLTRDGNWAVPADCYVDDDAAISAELEARGNVRFVDVPRETVPKLRNLMAVSGVQLVSQCLMAKRVSDVVEGSAVDDPLTQKLRSVARFLKRNMYARHHHQYVAHRELLNKLSGGATAVRVGSLVMRRSACGVTWDTPQPCLLEGTTLFITKECPDVAWQAMLAAACGVDPLIVHALATVPDPNALLGALGVSQLPLAEQP